MLHSWFYRSGGQLFGPVEFTELAQLAAKGELQPQDELRQSEQGQWVPASSVIGLFPEPEELQDLSELKFDFVASSAMNFSAAAGSDQVATLDDLDIRIVSEPAAPRIRNRSFAATGDSAFAAVEPPAVDSWFYQSLGRELGPLQFDALARLARDGVLSRDDMVRHGETGAWQRAVRVSELADEFPPPAAAEPPAKRVAESSPPSAPAATREARLQVEQHPPAADNGHPDTPPFSPQAAPEPVERWFCRIDDVEHGPLTLDELAGMARHNRIKPETQLKEGDDGTWTVAGTVSGLFAAPEPPAAGAAAAALQAASATPTYVPPQAKKEKKKKEKRPRAARDPLLPQLAQAIAKNKPVVFGALGLAAVVAAILFFAMGRSGSEVEHLNRMKAILDEHNALKSRNANKSEWQPLISKAEALKAEIYPDLEKNASSKRPQVQELLWASQDMLPTLQAGPATPNKHERLFVGHLKKAAELLKQPGEISAVEKPDTAKK